MARANRHHIPRGRCGIAVGKPEFHPFAAGSDQGKLLILYDKVVVFARILALEGIFCRQKGGFKDGMR